MDVLLTLPPSSAAHLSRNPHRFPFVTGAYSDPPGKKLGSGGGTAHVIWSHGLDDRRRIIIHGDGESRRLPAYAVTGKSLMPVPVFRWARGQRITQTLLDLQLTFLEKIMEMALPEMETLISSGDALIRTDHLKGTLPVADIVCIGVWAPPEIAARHGVFICRRNDMTRMVRMVQKPDPQTLQELDRDHVFLLDSGVWLLSRKAVSQLFRLCGWNEQTGAFSHGVPDFYDLYAEFASSIKDHSPEALTVRVFVAGEAGFYHFGSNEDLFRSMDSLQNLEHDQRRIWHKKIKPGQSLYVQNAVTGIPFESRNHQIWIENAFIPQGWRLHHHHILTGIPENQWEIDLPGGCCLDAVPVGEEGYCFRNYGFQDSFRGDPLMPMTLWQGRPVRQWFTSRGFPEEEIRGVLNRDDIFGCPLFPVFRGALPEERFVQWLVAADSRFSEEEHAALRSQWLACERLPGASVTAAANPERLYEQRDRFLKRSLPVMAGHSHQSIFYQVDLEHLAGEFIRTGTPLPAALTDESDVMRAIHDRMFRSAYYQQQKDSESLRRSEEYAGKAFSLLRSGMLGSLQERPTLPISNIQREQILWGRSPVRIDLAGGWTDTPPYCILFGGQVINLAVDLNSQPPIQVFIRPSADPGIVLHSIDQGTTLRIADFSDLTGHGAVGSAFSIAKAALVLAGFHPGYCQTPFSSLREQLTAFGGGFEITQMVAVPKGSGLGTSSILAATILGSLSEYCSLGWDRHEIAWRTLLLEQMLTTGGGWQDQFGGIFPGIKMLSSEPGLVQQPMVRWAPDHLFTRPETRELILLYYTGITRVAKSILADIVRGMFLNSSVHLGILAEMKHHAAETYEAIQYNDWEGLTRAVKRSWELNQRLDIGTNPEVIDAMVRKVGDYMEACKLPGAGGGGYLMIFAKDLTAVRRIHSILTGQPPNPGARFVDWKLSNQGLEISKS